MACNGGCGGSKAGKTIATRDVRTKSDPTAVFASIGGPRYMVKRHSGSSDGKRFSTLVAAQDYARRTGGIITQL
jgi:hypothetical protein